MSPFPEEDIMKARLSVELRSLAFKLLVIVMTHILGLENLAVHFPATASLSSSSKCIIWCSFLRTGNVLGYT